QGVAAVVDPQRDVDIYLDEADAQELQITHVIETHLHADHVSGNTELAARTGARIYVHAAANALFPHEPLAAADEIAIGDVRLRVLFTPGHTPEHICLTVTDTSRSPEPWFILTGDMLFVGDVGRPDLLGGAATRRLASPLYDSLHTQLLPLPDGLEVFPGHGAGSLCGRVMSSKLSTTVGFERRFNYALQLQSREEFIQSLTSDMPAQPPNVPFLKKLNREGPPVQGDLSPRPLNAAKVRRLLKGGALLVDTREPGAFGAGHAKGALCVPLSSNQFGTRLGFLVQPETPLVFVARNAADSLRAARAANRLGLDCIEGFITVAEARRLPQAKMPQWDVRRASRALASAGLTIVDVREKNEWEAGHAPGARNIPLGQLPARLAEVPSDEPVACMCAGGVRSISACSVLARAGYTNVVNVTGGFDQWAEEGLPVER
ncbi:MAG: MBL fold metallo-hydrolase, partial [Chloroflexi bacterium]|nr:MBL fold metallo-hydrolase [Chloroflexota bacterium]